MEVTENGALKRERKAMILTETPENVKHYEQEEFKF